MQVPNTFVASSIAKSSEVNENFDEVEDAIKPTFLFTITGTLVTGTDLTPGIIVHKALTIEKAFAYVANAPSGANIIVDINKNGTSIWNATPSNRVLITAGQQIGTQASFDVTALAEEDILTIDVDQIGSTTAGVKLTIALRCS